MQGSQDGGWIIKGLLRHSSHNIQQIIPTPIWICPRFITRVPGQSVTSCIPMLPMNIAEKLISADADPESSSCCSSIKWVPGTRTVITAIVTGPTDKASNQGDIWPKTETTIPHTVIRIKHPVIISLGSICLLIRI